MVVAVAEGLESGGGGGWGGGLEEVEAMAVEVMAQ